MLTKEVIQMKLSVLDQSPVSDGMSEREALEVSALLALRSEQLGYERFWIAEHHDLYGLACPNPAVMLAMIGARTNTIRIGAGAVLLPYYKPFHVAETYNLLATLYPGRIDLGIGRAPGGSAEVSMALSDNYLAGVKRYPRDIDELQSYLTKGFEDESDPRAKISPTPIPDISPQVWLLGTSKNSAIRAAEKNMPYAFAHFMTEKNGPKVVDTYRKKFADQEREDSEPYAIVAISVICAETTEEAEDLALSQFLWSIRQDQQVENVRIPEVAEAKQYEFTKEELEKIEKIKEKMIIGNPDEVKAALTQLDKQYQADEYMVVTIVHDPLAKVKSYELLKKIADQID